MFEILEKKQLNEQVTTMMLFVPFVAKKAIVIGGGAGCAIAYPQAKALHTIGVDTTVSVGFRSRDTLQSQLTNI